MLLLINQRQQHHFKQLSLLHEIFQFDSEESPRLLTDLVKEKLMLGNFSTSAKIRLTVVEARGIMSKDANGLSDPYCLVQVGKIIKRTSVKKNTLAPSWNENFEFKVDSARESIKIRMWDEDDDLRARLKETD
jgi:Ca2+-dependent lipid-binding protein